MGEKPYICFMKDKYTIYKLFFKGDERIYVGKTSLRLEQRINTHIQNLKRDLHTNKYFVSAYKKYGQENLFIEPLEICSFNNASEREVFWIKYFRQQEIELNKIILYNIKDISNGSIQYNLTEEQRRKISEKAKGRKKSIEHRQKLSEVNKGKKHTEESKQKIREWYEKSGGWTEEQRKMMGEAASYKRSDETKMRMANASEIQSAKNKGMTLEQWQEHKKQAVKYWIEEKATLTQVKQKFNVDKSMLYVWKKKYLEGQNL